MTTWYDEEHDAVVVCLWLPEGVDEAVHPNEDGTFSIFLRESMPDARKVKAYHHALKHIRRNDFAPGSVQAVEESAHKGGTE